VHLYCVIPSNIPFVIQRDVLVCEQSDRRHDSQQTYIAALGRCFPWRIRMPNAFVRRHSNSDSTSNRYVFWLYAQVYWSFFCCISEYNRKKQSTWSTTGELLTDKVVRAFYFALLRLGNFKTSGCLVGRPTCAPATTRLTPQLVGVSAKTYNLSPYSLVFADSLKFDLAAWIPRLCESVVRSCFACGTCWLFLLCAIVKAFLAAAANQ